MSRGLDNIKLAFSPLSETIYLFRHGKNETLALDKRAAEHDVMRVLVDMMMSDAPKGAEKIVTFQDIETGIKERYKIRVEPVLGEDQ